MASRKTPSDPPAATRRQLLLTLPALCLAPAALANKPKGQAPPNRVKLPTDTALAVSVRVKGRFTSLYNQQTRQLDLPTTICSFALDESPNEDNLDFYEIAFMPDIAEAGWGAFAPADETLVYHFAITDAKRRLNKLVVSELNTGRVIGALHADSGGASLTGRFKLPSAARNYLLRGTDKRGQTLFTLVTNNGKADTYIFFPLTGSFQPFRTQYHRGAGFADHGSGPWGDPYSLNGVQSYLSIGNADGAIGSSLMEVFTTETNDRNSVWPLAPPEGSNLPRRQTLLDEITPELSKYKPADRDEFTRLMKWRKELLREDATPVLSEITMPPYSENCARWEVYLIGTAATVLAVPNNRFKNHTVEVIQALEYFNKTAQPEERPLGEMFLAGMQDGLNGTVIGRRIANEIVSLGNLYILEAQAAGTDIDSKPLLDSVSLRVTPAPADPNHLLSYESSIELVGPNTMPSPPPITRPTNFR